MRRGFAIFLVVSFISLVAVAYSQKPPTKPPPATVPSLEGQELAAALQKVGGDFELSYSEENSEQPEGTIISQRPESGTKAPPGETVSVVVSSGPEMEQVPNVVGKTRDEAEDALAAAGLDVEVKTRESPEEDAGRVLQQSPFAGEAEKGSQVSITIGGGCRSADISGSVRCYVLAEDLAGSLKVEVPSGWGLLTGSDSEGAGGNWSDFVGERLSSSITTAPNLDAWHTSGRAAAGAYIVASRALTQAGPNDKLIYAGPFAGMSNTCENGGRKPFNRAPYSGSLQTWHNCGGKGTTFYTVAASPEDRECVILLQVGFDTEEEYRVAQHILQTFEADCGRVS